MAEFTSKKIIFSEPESVAPVSTEWIETTLTGFTQCVIKTEEVYQDFITYGRSSRTKAWCIGSVLLVIVVFIIWFLRRRIRLLV